MHPEELPVLTKCTFEGTSAMEKRQLIDDIRKFNPTAGEQFLLQFDAQALEQYLAQLQAARERRVHISGWVRQRRKMRIAS